MPGLLDAVLVDGGGDEGDLRLIPRADLNEHPRVARALRLRKDVRVYSDPGGSGVLVIGRGLVGRWEVGLDAHPDARGSGMAGDLLAAARTLVPAGQPIFAQVAPGTARSLRAFLSAGFRPIGSEVLFP